MSIGYRVHYTDGTVIIRTDGGILVSVFNREHQAVAYDVIKRLLPSGEGTKVVRVIKAKYEQPR